MRWAKPVAVASGWSASPVVGLGGWWVRPSEVTRREGDRLVTENQSRSVRWSPRSRWGFDSSEAVGCGPAAAIWEECIRPGAFEYFDAWQVSDDAAPP